MSRPDFETPRARLAKRLHTALGLLPWLVLVFLAYRYIVLAAYRDVLLNSDFFSFARRIDALGTSPWRETWVNGLYPVGYPLLIKALWPIGGSYLVTARYISVVFGLVGIWAAGKLAQRVGGLGLALCVMVLTGLNTHYLTFSTSEGTDIPAAALMLCGLALAAMPGRSLKKSAAIGAIIGLGYLLRYTAILALPALCIAWLFQDFKSWKATARSAAALIFGFLVFSALQWIPSLIATGNPFYNTQHWNVWYALEGHGQWWRISTEGARYKSLIAVVDHTGWQPFFHNAALNAFRLLRFDTFNTTLWYFPLHLLWPLGAALVVWKRPSAGLVALLMLALFGAAVSITFLSPRVLLIMLPLELTLAGYLVSIVFSKAGNYQSAVWALILLVVCYHGNQVYRQVGGLTRTPFSVGVAQLPQVLRSHGMTDVKQVLSFSHNLYDVQSPNCARFSLPWLTSPAPIQSADEVAWLCLKNRYRFVAIDDNAPADIAGFRQWYKQGAMQPPLQSIYKGAGLEAYAVPDSIQHPAREANEQDWQNFCQTTNRSHSQSLYTRIQPVLQENAPLDIAYQNRSFLETLAAWRAYKGKRRLR